MSIDVRYQDEHLLVLNKPAGLLSVPGRGADKQDCLSARVQHRFADALVVHRLDMATSGLLLMARSPAMQRLLSQLFEARQIDKIYVAVVAGRMTAPAGVWQLIDLPIAVDWPCRPRRLIDHLHGKPSQTRYQITEKTVGSDSTRVTLQPITGRSHQLRVHLKALGHPILGDALYADAATQAKAPRLLLHAQALALVHPATQKRLALICPPPF